MKNHSIKSTYTPSKKTSKLNKSMSTAGLNKENSMQYTSLRQDTLPQERKSTVGLNKENSIHYTSLRQGSVPKQRKSTMGISKQDSIQDESLRQDSIPNERVSTVPRERVSTLNDRSVDISTSISISGSVKSPKTTFATLMNNIGQLKDLEQQCFENPLLKEAHHARLKAEELKKELGGKAKREVEVMFKKATEELMDVQAIELNEFNQFWEMKMGDYESEVYIIETDMIDRHTYEKEELKQELNEILPVKVKMTKQHVDHRKDLEVMLKTREYLQADYLIKMCRDYQKDEVIKAKEDKERRVKFLMGQVEIRHRNELNVIRKRISTGREEILKTKAMELEKLLSKFTAVRQQLRTDQQLELSKLEVVSKANAWESIAFNERVRTPVKNRQRTKSRDLNLSNTLNISMALASPVKTVKDFLSSTIRSPAAATSIKTTAKKVGHNRSFSSTKTSSTHTIPDAVSINAQPAHNKVKSSVKVMERRFKL